MFLFLLSAQKIGLIDIIICVVCTYSYGCIIKNGGEIIYSSIRKYCFFI